MVVDGLVVRGGLPSFLLSDFLSLSVFLCLLFFLFSCVFLSFLCLPFFPVSSFLSCVFFSFPLLLFFPPSSF